MKEELIKMIFKYNANAVELAVGRSVKGKGAEIFDKPQKVYEYSTYWECSFDELKKYNQKDYYIGSLVYFDLHGVTHRYEPQYPGDKNFSIDDVYELAENGNKINQVAIYKKPKTLGYIPLNKFNPGSYSDQIRFMDTILGLKGYSLTEDGEIEESDEYDVVYNERSLAFTKETYEEKKIPYEYFDGRMSCVNQIALQAFWNNVNTICNFRSIDKELDVIVYTYKGKDWYIASAVDLEWYEVSIIKKGDEGYGLDYELFELQKYKTGDQAKKIIEEIVMELGAIKEELEEECEDE